MAASFEKQTLDDEYLTNFCFIARQF